MTAIAVSYSNGQARITYTPPATGATENNYRYDGYISTSAQITSLGSATKFQSLQWNTGGLMNTDVALTGWNQTYRQNSASPMVTLTNGGTALTYGTGLMVYTVASPGTLWAAVITVPNPAGSTCTTASALSAGNNATTSGVAVSVAAIQPVTQWLSTDAVSGTAAGNKLPGSTAGFPLWIYSHGSGGSMPTYGDLHLLFGNTSMGWQDGIQSKNHCYWDTTTYGRPTVICKAGDRVWTEDGNSSIETYWTGYDVIPPFSGDPTRHVYPTTLNRQAYWAPWLIGHYGADPNRIYADGQSMGGHANAMYAMRHHDLFAAVFGKVPVLWWGGQITSQTTGGTINTITGGGSPLVLNVTVPDGVTAYHDYEDTPVWLADCSHDSPPFIFGGGRLDTTLQSVSATTYKYQMWQNYINVLNADKTCHRWVAFEWNNGDHSTGASAPAPIYTQYQASFSRNTSYPVPANFSLDANPGDGSFNSSGPLNGSATGCVNCGWIWSDIAENATNWRAYIDNTLITTTATADITPGNTQQFTAAPGSSVRWTSSTGQTALVTADSNGFVTAIGVTIPPEGVTISFGPAASTGLFMPLNTWVNLHGTGFVESPVGYDKTTWVGAPLNAACTFVNYQTRGVTSEIQDSMMCHRYNENRFTVVSQGGGPHGLHHSDNGHQVGIQEYFPDSGYLFWNSNQSYGNAAETVLEAWAFDAPGLTVRPIPLPPSSSNGNAPTRVWFANTGGELNDAIYDPVRHKLLIVPDYRNLSGQQVCDVVNGQLTSCKATSTTCADGSSTCIPKPLQLPSGAYNTADGKIYVWGGLNTTSDLNSNMYTYDAGADQWSLVPTTCSGVDCNGSTPPPRNCAGLAYSTRDNLFLMIGGNNAATSCNSGTPMFQDTWTFNPATKAWAELCNNCGYSTTQGTFDKLIYNPNDNVFEFFVQETGYIGAGPYAFAISTPLNAGRTVASPPSLATSLNRVTPSGDLQGNAFDPSVSASGPNLYVAHAETGTSADRTNCQVPKAYVGSIDVTGTFTWYPGGSYTSACNASIANQPTSLMPQSHVFAATIGGALLQVHEKHNYNGALGATASHGFMQTYDPASGTWAGGEWAAQTPGGSIAIGTNTITMSPLPVGLAVNSVVLISGGGAFEYDTVTSVSGSQITFSARYVHTGAWTIGPSGYIPCFTRDCSGMGAVGTGGKVNSYPVGLISVAGVPTVTVIEQDTQATNPREHNVFVARYVSGAWTALGGATRLNVNTTGTAAFYASAPATDGAGNVAECWTEGVNSTRNTMTLSPQLYCKLWNGAAWSRMGTTSLNHAATNWSYAPSVAWSGAWYVAWTEQPQIGLPALYVSKYNAGTNTWSAVGTNPLNVNTTTGLTYHPSLTSDGSGTLYLAWEEQSARGQHSLGHVKRWNGTTWTQLGTDIAHDVTNGSIQDISIAIVQGTPMVGFAELTYNNLQQVYVRMWDGSAWQTAVSGSSAPQIQSTSPLTSGTAGASYSYGFAATGVPAPTWTATGLPSGSALNSTTGVLTWASPATGSYSFPVTATNSAGSDVKTFALVIAAAGTAPSIQDISPLPVGTSGTAYSYTFTATGSPIPTWTSSGIPSGSALSSSGVFTWAAPDAGSYSFTVTATNSVGATSPKTFALTINAAGIPPAITSLNAFTCAQAVGCTIDLTATGNPTPTWAIVSGTLPSGLALTDPAGGIISGVPSSTGIYTVTVGATNGVSPDATQAITITVSAASANIVTIQERLYPATTGGANITGVTRIADPVTFGVPFPDDSTGIASTDVLGVSGATAGQFRALEVWPSGRLKWVLLDTLADVTANLTNTDLTITGGSGNFGGADLATDNGTTLTVSTGAGTFTVKKANFNLFDIVVVGAKTLVQTGTSPGLVILGPDPAATYPGNVTCSTDGSPHAGVSSLCNHEYRSSNDAASTVTVEENGPVKAVLKADGSYKDGSGNGYMHFTVRLTFYKGKASVKMTRAIRNADLGTSNTFASAYKGHDGEEARIALNVSGTTTFSMGNHTATPTNGFLSTGEDVYLYQGLSTFLAQGATAPPSDCPSFHDTDGYCALRTPDLGYRIAKNGVNVLTGTSAQVPQGWADISDSTGAGMEIGIYQMAAYSAKSLEFKSGGTDVRIGLWASENSIPYYQQWPQYDFVDAWFNFHATAPLNLPAEFLKYQLPLVGRVDRTVYNNARVFEHTLLDPTEEDAFYVSVGETANSPLISSKMLTLKDSAAAGTNSTYQIYPWQYRSWEAGGGGNQMDYSLAKTYNFLTRGYTGGLVDATHMYRFVSSMGFPRSDGFTWRSQAASAHDSQGFPTATSANGRTQISGCGTTSGSATISIPSGAAVHSFQYVVGGGIPAGATVVSVSGTTAVLSANATATNASVALTFIHATRSWPATFEHVHSYGAEVYYALTGDEWVRDGLQGPLNMYLLSPIVLPGTERGVGIYFEHLTHLGKFFRDTGDAATYNALVAQGQNLYSGSAAPDLCVSGWPVGCTTAANPRGISRVRGLFYAGTTTIATGTGTSEPYCGTTPTRGSASFQSSEFLEGLGEFRGLAGPSWSKYGESFDLMYGVSQWAFAENYYDNGTGAWAPNTSTLCVVPAAPPVPLTTVFTGTGQVGTGGACGNGYRHYVLLDVPTSCSVFYYPIRAEQTVWYEFLTAHAYTGNLSWVQKFKMALARTAFVGATEEFGNYSIAQTIDRALRPGTVSLTPVPITSFTDNGGGSYTISWNAPMNGVSYAVKWGPKQIVDWVGYDAYNGVFLGNPTTTMNWFAATTAPGIPNPGTAGTVQSMTILTGTTGLTAPNFAMKAYVDSAGTAGVPGNATTTVKTGPVKTIVK